MKIDIRQIVDLFDTCGYTLVEKGRPQSFDNWNIDSEYEFESKSKKVTVSFTIDPLPGYMSAGSNSRRKGKKKIPVTLDIAEFVIIDHQTGESTEYELDLRNSDHGDIRRLKNILTYL